MLQDLVLGLGELAIEGRIELGGGLLRRVLALRQLDGPRPQPSDQSPEALRGGGALLPPGRPGLGVRQLLRDFREVDLEVMKQDIMHGC